MTKKDSKISKPTALLDIVLILVGSAVLFAGELAARSAGLLPLGDDSQGVIAVLGGMMIAFALVFARGQTLSEIGFRRPPRLWTVPLWAIGILAAYIAGQALIPLLISNIIQLPAPDVSRHNNIYQNLPAAIAMVLILPLTASIPEEVIYRGFLMDRFTRIFGATRTGTFLTILAQGLIFGSVHFQWGVGGMIVTTIMGMIWGTAYVLCKRNLWIVIAAHSLGHILFVVQLYFVEAVAPAG